MPASVVSGTNAPYSVMSVTRPVSFFAPTGYLTIAPSQGSLSSCFMPRLMRWVSFVDADDLHLTVSPMFRTSLG